MRGGEGRDLVDGVNVGAALEEKACDGGGAVDGGEVQGLATLGESRIDARTEVEQELDEVIVAAHDCHVQRSMAVLEKV